ncbi:MAG TPA: hypothetical protein PKZ76_17580 [Xanthomonadaceae bacterium]|nr:hypothetical protein [Xanthomonadaceae bacterium]
MSFHRDHAEAGLHHLKNALTEFQKAGSVRATARLRATLKSAEGAVRAAEYRDQRAARRLETRR